MPGKLTVIGEGAIFFIIGCHNNLNSQIGCFLNWIKNKTSYENGSITMTEKIMFNWKSTSISYSQIDHSPSRLTLYIVNR